MRVFSSEHTFDYSWEEVSTANWRKYCPWNDKSTHVVAVDTLSRHVDPESGVLRTERLITCQQSAPAWVRTLLGGNCTSHVYEVSYVSPSAKKVTMCSNNLTWSNIISVRETVIYQPATTTASASSSSSSAERQQQHQQLQQHPALTPPPNSLEHEREHKYEKTQFQQKAEITALCGGWQKLKTKIEEASVERFGQNAARGREGFLAVLEMSRRVWGEEREREKQRSGRQHA